MQVQIVFSLIAAVKSGKFSGMETGVQERVLVCPLEWGLGHATRCVPLIRALLMQGWEVVVAADGAPLAFLRQEFGAQLAYHRFPGKIIRYPANDQMGLKILFQLPGLLFSVIREHRHLKRIVRETAASMVISDNRYGLWNKEVFSVFITHQVFIRAPKNWKWAEPLLWRVVRFFIRHYDQCWVPDFESEPNLSGALSHNRKFSDLIYIGPLSRFSELAKVGLRNPLPKSFPGDFYLVVLSGPEPQRTQLEETLSRQFAGLDVAVIFVLGRPQASLEEHKGKRLVLSHASTSHLAWLIENARLVICRPGYSSLMDLAIFGKKALLIPTPGQTEQEYLGDMLKQQEQAHCVNQGMLDLQRDLPLAEDCTGIRKTEINDTNRKELIGALLKRDQ